MYARAVSLTDLSQALFEHTRFPVAALVAGHAARLTLQKIDEPQRDVFDASLSPLVDWWPDRRKRPLVDVWNEVHPEPIRIRDELKGKAKKAADVCVRALYLQVSNLERVSRAKRGLPVDCYSVEKEDLERLLRDAIRIHGHTQVRDMARRLKVLDETSRKGQWPDLVDAASRMGWTRLEPGLRNLPARLRDLAEAIDGGGQAEMIDVGGRAALRVTAASGERRVGVLSDEEMETLRGVIPWIPAA